MSSSAPTQPSSNSLSVEQNKFYWVETDEPHATRRKQILAKYPQMEKLFVREIRTCPIVILIFACQLSVAYYLQHYSTSWLVFLFAAWGIGGTLNHSLQLAVHELAHNLCFDNLIFNKLLGIFCNLPTGLPSAIVFQKYHMEHHRFQGVDGIDTDIPSSFEVRVFTNSLSKVLWVFLQPLFYGIRPLFVRPKQPGYWETINGLCVFSFDILVFFFIGGKALGYLLAGTFLGLGLHPCAGHFIAEHYVFSDVQETYSYYGICNYLNFNVGYHNEHHDFPKIPWSQLPKVREIAPEFYTMPYYTSYVEVIWRYITDPTIGPFSRVKRSSSSSTPKTIVTEDSSSSPSPSLSSSSLSSPSVLASSMTSPNTKTKSKSKSKSKKRMSD